jgi:hypothetical protein
MAAKPTLWCFSALYKAGWFFKVNLRLGNIPIAAKSQDPSTNHPWCVLWLDRLEVHLNLSTLELAHEKLFSIFQDILGR